ncbi:alpha/beta hydrolase [Lactobacillus equicursoris]|uniref:Alpha/beta hydrolase n=1 Tax=Lactobacillus equicursoris TaxID=420645 RepID=A0A844FP61_9LACO|nr:alpha/beta hydrolase [Lactobacillus equicursoris]MST80167.1 alpha/beta hydrolase [Lactobacillus equicursoris]
MSIGSILMTKVFGCIWLCHNYTIDPVLFAGHYNGIKGYSANTDSPLTTSGKPEHMDATYKDLLYLRQVYPKGVAVLNIYGDIGNGSDERVYNNSSKSLKYLVVNGRSYQEVKIKGAKGQHSQLHESGKVDRAMQKFLWN